MSIERTNHYILNYLDEPTRILFFTPGEIAAIVVFFFGGCFSNHFLLGLLFSFLSVIIIRKIRAQFKVQSLPQLAYWFLPFVHKNMKRPFPSAIDEFLS